MEYLLLPSFLIFAGFYHSSSWALHLNDISVPEVIDYRDRAKLSCTYSMGKHKLNSMKWYKDDMEFFRYAPMNTPTIVNFTVNGVHLLDETFNCNTYKCSVTLEYLEQRTSGSYRCEISGDAPEFKLVSKTANMTVAALPRTDPDIDGIASHSYTYGDSVLANCTSDKSSPPASITWYINDKLARFEYTSQQQESIFSSNGFQLRSRNQLLQFPIENEVYKNNQLILKCVAKIGKLPSEIPREKIYIIHIEDVKNQKLVNWRNSASKVQYCYLSFIVTLFTTQILRKRLYV